MDREFQEQEEQETDETEHEHRGRRWLLGVGAVIVALVLVFALTGVRPFVVAGISMEPAYERGDVAFIREASIDSLEVGDVVKFSKGPINVVHRIVELGDDGTIITQGDNVARPDPPLHPEQIDGKVIFLIPKIGIVSIWIDDLFN